MRSVVLAAALCCAVAPWTVASAQQALVVGAPATPMLRVGTEIPVKTRTELTTERKALRAGQRFEVETTEPVMLGGQVVIPLGTTGVGEVTSVSNKGMWGKSGHFDVQLLYLRVGDRQIRLTGNADDKGKAGGAAAVAVSAIIFLPAGFFMTGTSARLPIGTVIKGFLAEDLPVSFAGSTAPVPLVVAAPAAPAAAAPVPVTVPVAQPAGAELVKVSAPK